MQAGNIIHLIGFPGVGKLTIAKQMIAQRNALVLVDNHLINNPVFSVLSYDGKRALPPNIWAKVAGVRAIVLDVIKDVSPAHLSFVMTNVMIEDAEDLVECRKIEAAATYRGGSYFPVLITCDVEENVRRIVGAERRSNLKAIDPGLPARMHEGPGLITSFDDHTNVLRLDVTEMSPAETAAKILNHVFSN